MASSLALSLKKIISSNLLPYSLRASREPALAAQSTSWLFDTNRCSKLHTLRRPLPDRGSKLLLHRPLLDRGSKLLIRRPGTSLLRPLPDRGSKLLIRRPLLDRGSKLLIRRPLLDRGSKLLIRRPGTSLRRPLPDRGSKLLIRRPLPDRSSKLRPRIADRTNPNPRRPVITAQIDPHDFSGVRETKDSLWDAKETDDNLCLQMDIPGLDKEDVKVVVEQNPVIVKGDTIVEQNTMIVKDETKVIQEKSEKDSGRRYTNRIDLPSKLYKTNQIKAEMKNGVLKVAVPKLKEVEQSNACVPCQG